MILLALPKLDGCFWAIGRLALAATELKTRCGQMVQLSHSTASRLNTGSNVRVQVVAPKQADQLTMMYDASVSIYHHCKGDRATPSDGHTCSFFCRGPSRIVPIV